MKLESVCQEAAVYVRERMAHEGTGHDWRHIDRVTKLAIAIAAREGADVGICQLAALFHDLPDDKLTDSKEQELENIVLWMNRHHVPDADVRHIVEIIATMSFRGGGGAPMRTLEGQVVQDADRLDAIGAIGIARTFTYAGAKGHLIHEPESAPRGVLTAEQYRNEPGTAIHHFYEKLLMLKDLMNTPTARALATERHLFMEQFLHQFYKEWDADISV
ncbi:phosphohydrolase [Xylanibacillus composti]|uniref:Phosphohydrolase n=1 Tax=Xylanibacillus composti TaxID=1572762 RepID=A0A8J4M305_9BACL|nr:HD domain-containing protein [Xylanibacillus composti]GIQ69605.1 phosphohydrolase [Xylanibacillus composti]